jgi:asparagine N-glycosylation enzyme membrane subunit Stt3
VAVIILVAIYYRTPMLRYFGFYEPDGYYHFSEIRYAVKHDFALPRYTGISGWPDPAPVDEPFGLYWVTLAPYALVQFLGVSYYTVMRLVPVLFGIFDIIGAYFLSRYLSKDKLFGLLVMLFVALNMGNAARTSALIYRGDSFVTAFALVSMIFAIEIFRTDARNRKIAYALVSGLFLALCDFVWGGGSFATAVYAFAFTLILLLGFTFDRKKLIKDSKYLLCALMAFYLFVQLFVYTGNISGEPTFAGPYFFFLFFAMVIGWLAASVLIGDGPIRLHEKHHRAISQYIDTPYKRFAMAVGFTLLAVLVIYVAIPGLVYSIFVSNGFETNGSNFTGTIQELQPPTAAFIFASFSLQTYLTPMGLLVMASTYYPALVDVFWGVMLLTFIVYFFMRIYDSRGFAGGRARVAFDFDAGLLMLISFFALTAYLQMHAIRFNSLLSVPLSIFAAFTVYWLVMFCKRNKPAYIASYALVAILAVFLFYIAAQYIVNLYPADNITPQFIQALAWMKNNTPGNSVVLTLWPDGSVVEGVANLTSVTDSVGSQNVSKCDPFAAWLFNSSPDPQFLTGSLSGSPNYLLVRSTWMYETGGIFTESGINTNSNNYGYDSFTGVSEKVNSTLKEFQFSGGGLSEITVLATVNGVESVSSYMVVNNMTISPFKYVYFYNENNGSVSSVQQTAFNKTNNQSFFIVYSTVPSPSMYANITGAYVMSTGLADSNMAEFLFKCGTQSCPWDNSVASLQLIYANSDTKIFKILYNQSKIR